MPRVTKEYREARRVDILRAAATCFAQRGFAATHMRDVAQRAGLSTGAVYRYFPGKEEIFKAMLDWQRPQESSVLGSLLKGDTPFAQLEGLLEGLAPLMAQSKTQAKRNFRDYGEAAGTPFLARELRRGVSHYIDRIEEVIRHAQHTGEIDGDVDPRTVATIFATQSVALRFALLFGGSFNAATMADTLTRLLKGLAPNP